MQEARNLTSHQQRKQKLVKTVLINNDPNRANELQLTIRSITSHRQSGKLQFCQQMKTSAQCVNMTCSKPHVTHHITHHVQTVSETQTALACRTMAAFALANARTQVFAVVTSTSTSFRHTSQLA